MKINDLKEEYDQLQQKYGAKELDAIYNGGCECEPNICFIFMNPTGRNIASLKTWEGRKSPWIGTKNIWKVFYNIGLISDDIYNAIETKKPTEWDYKFADLVYKEIEDKKVFITNLGKCTQIDARPLSNKILKQYLDLLLKEIEIIKPKIIVTFGNQVSSIFLNETINVSKCRKLFFSKEIAGKNYKVFPVYYPVGNGMRNINSVIDDLNKILENYIK